MPSHNNNQTKYKALKAIELSDTNFLSDLGPEHVCTGFMFDPDVFRHNLGGGTLEPLATQAPPAVTAAMLQQAQQAAPAIPLIALQQTQQAAPAVTAAILQQTQQAPPAVTAAMLQEAPGKRITKKSAARKKGKTSRKNY